MIEVEVKAKIHDRDEMVDRILSLGGVHVSEEEQHDLYFNAPHRDFARTDEALRIRRSGGRTFITYKGPKIDEESKTRKELETEVADPGTAAEILESLGFRMVREVVKERRIYSVGEFTVSIDTVMGLGTYLEIERDLPDGSDYAGALREIFELYRKLGIEDGFERRSYLELLELGEE
ncbi:MULTISPECIES: class IV adenylate cyclase [Methanothermobacter]|uniref:Adenylate cyclase n=1 Tax=Methanothermobacter defluvii TaxID=49339 RepID=A0A371NBD6_9EURY|nr:MULTISPECIES: class IV adenylate cyclase [Methanothermobacter]REE26316.1 adenylate cyclase [Methanothermobacter defluvii]WBF07910.1 class IV adenylate cyclase [Methanothermobacter thermautotrophicus]